MPFESETAVLTILTLLRRKKTVKPMCLEMNRLMGQKACDYVVRLLPDPVENKLGTGAKGTDVSVFSDFRYQMGPRAIDPLFSPALRSACPQSSLYLSLAAYHYLIYMGFQHSIDLGIYEIRSHYFVMLSDPSVLELEGSYDLGLPPTPSIISRTPLAPRRMKDIFDNYSACSTTVCSPYLQDVFDTTDAEAAAKRIAIGRYLEFTRDKSDAAFERLTQKMLDGMSCINIVVRSSSSKY